MIKIITDQIDHKNYLRSFYLLFTFELNHRFIYRKETIKHQKDSDLQNKSTQNFIIEMERTVIIRNSSDSCDRSTNSYTALTTKMKTTVKWIIEFLSTRELK